MWVENWIDEQIKWMEEEYKEEVMKGFNEIKDRKQHNGDIFSCAGKFD